MVRWESRQKKCCLEMNGKRVCTVIPDRFGLVFSLNALLAPSTQALGYKFLLKLLSQDLLVLASPLFDNVTSHIFDTQKRHPLKGIIMVIKL
jgi:hypothetical protein